jgi:hypothetical protein
MTANHDPPSESATMQPPGHQSPLLRLPAEIRNQIYEYVMCGQTIDLDVLPPPNLFSLPRTCRQIYHETELLLYSGNTFRTRDLILLEWLADRSARQLAAIQSVQYVFKLSLEWDNSRQCWQSLAWSDLFAPEFPRLSRPVLPALRRVIEHAEATLDQLSQAAPRGPTHHDVFRWLSDEIEVVEITFPGVAIIKEFDLIYLET